MSIPPIEEVVQIAETAGKEILAIYRSGDFSVVDKEDASPLTEADIASHKYIVGALTQISTYPVLSEENPIEYSERCSWENFWLVDPLDGTKDFIAKNDEFTVNIALIQGNRPTLGVVHIPVWNTTYFAINGGGAFKKIGDKSARITHAGPKSNLICLESRFHGSQKTAEFCARYGIKELLRFGSSIKICKIAEGVADVYPRYAPTKEWDTAAAHCILKEANGSLIDGVTAKELLYNKPKIENNSFVAFGQGLNFSL